MRSVAVENQAALEEAVNTLVELFTPQENFLFGSRARGDASNDSDYDLMVIVPSSDLPRHHREQMAYQALFDVRIPMDILVWTREEFEQFRPAVASLAATVLSEGTLLDAAR